MTPRSGSSPAATPAPARAASWIKASAKADGSFTVTNPRNGFGGDYPVRELTMKTTERRGHCLCCDLHWMGFYHRGSTAVSSRTETFDNSPAGSLLGPASVTISFPSCRVG